MNIKVAPDKFIKTMIELIEAFDYANEKPIPTGGNCTLDFLEHCCINDIGFYYKKRFALCDTQGPHDVEEFYKDEEEI